MNLLANFTGIVVFLRHLLDIFFFCFFVCEECFFYRVEIPNKCCFRVSVIGSLLTYSHA